MSVVNTMLRDLDARSGELRQPKIPVRDEAPARRPWLLIATVVVATAAIGWQFLAPQSGALVRTDAANALATVDPSAVAVSVAAPVVATPPVDSPAAISAPVTAERVADSIPAVAVQSVESTQVAQEPASLPLRASWQWSKDGFALQLDDVHDVRYGIERVDAKTLKISLTHASLALLDIPAPTPRWIENLKLQRDVQQQTVTVSAQARLEYEIAKLDDGALVISVWRDARSTVANDEYMSIATTEETPSAAPPAAAAPPREYASPRIDRSTLTPAQRDSRQSAEAATQLRAGQQSQAIKTLRTVLQSGEAAPKSAALLVTILMSQQRLRDAQPYLDRALQQTPKDGALLKLKARMLAAQGDVAGARQILAPLTAEVGTDIELLGLAASLAQQSQDFEAAATHYLQWTRIEPDSGAAWYGLALAFDAQASSANAIAAYQRALALIRDTRLRDYASTRLVALQRGAAESLKTSAAVAR